MTLYPGNFYHRPVQTKSDLRELLKTVGFISAAAMAGSLLATAIVYLILTTTGAIQP